MISLCTLNYQRFDVGHEMDNRGLPEMEDLYAPRKPGDEFLTVDTSKT
ncbi:12396_t:CDS:1, partial [Cetraspora pellucida]